MFDAPTAVERDALLAAIASRQEQAFDRQIADEAWLIVQYFGALNYLNVPVYHSEALQIAHFPRYNDSLLSIDVQGERAFEVNIHDRPTDREQIFDSAHFYRMTDITRYRPGAWEKTLHRVFLQARKLWLKKLAEEARLMRQQTLDAWGLDVAVAQAA